MRTLMFTCSGDASRNMALGRKDRKDEAFMIKIQGVMRSAVRNSVVLLALKVKSQ